MRAKSREAGFSLHAIVPGRAISTASPRRQTALFLAAALCLAFGLRAEAEVAPCDAAESGVLDAAMARIEASVDPCGESGEVRALLEGLRRCSRAAYHVCTRTDAARNLFDRPASDDGPRTITWNPELRSELESSCDDGNTRRPLRRDPIASLLHELVHAAHDCAGLDPGKNELEAVRIENIYRRAAGLCQRTRYGDDPLPSRFVISCAPGHCSCLSAAPREAKRATDGDDDARPSRLRLGDSGSDPGAAAR